MRLSDRLFSSCRLGLVAAGAVFVVAAAAPVQMPTSGDLSILNSAEASARRASRSSAAQQESACDATCLNNQQLQALQGGGMGGGGMSGSGAGMSGASMSGGPAPAPSVGSTYRGGTGGQPRSEAEAAERAARSQRR